MVRIRIIVLAALLLPSYYLADATITLLCRMARGEPFWAAHRNHFYQRATDNGITATRAVGEVLALNVVLAVLAMISVGQSSPMVGISLLLTGAFAVAVILYRFSRKRFA